MSKVSLTDQQAWSESRSPRTGERGCERDQHQPLTAGPRQHHAPAGPEISQGCSWPGTAGVWLSGDGPERDIPEHPRVEGRAELRSLKA